MLSVCVDFGQVYNVKFNSSKSRVTACSNVNIVVNDNFTLNGDIINIYYSVQHLGRDVGDSDSNCKVINTAIGELYMRTNYITSKFGICSSDIRKFLFRTYCTSYYGSPLRI